MGTPSKRELDALVKEAIVDAYDEYEQTTGFVVMIGDNVGFPSPPPAGSERIAAYRHWLTGA